MLINSISGWINPSETEKGLNQKINTKLKFKIVTSEPTQTAFKLAFDKLVRIEFCGYQTRYPANPT